jgi:TIGR02453 family protein
MKQVIDFLMQLRDNNTRTWFEAHKSEYLAAKARFEAFTQELIDGIRSFDNSIGELAAKDCTYRIYRDVRFSHDKRPYKTHFGAFIVPEGKKSGYSGYYFHVGVEPEYGTLNSLLATGDYCFMPEVLKIIREDIVNDDDKLFEQSLNTAKGFVLDQSNMLKRIPRGFEDGHSYSNYLKYKSFCLIKSIDNNYILSPRLLQRTLDDFKTTQPFLWFINRAITYAKTGE